MLQQNAKDNRWLKDFPCSPQKQKNYHKLHVETQKFPGSQNVWSKMSYAFVIAVFCSMFHRKGVIKKKQTSSYWQKTHTSWMGTGFFNEFIVMLSPPPFFLQRYQNLHWRREPFQQRLLGKLEITTRRMELELCLSRCSKPNSKWIDDLKVD